MRVPSATEMLSAWERGLNLGPVERGLILLGLASQEDAPPELATLSVGERNRRLLQLREVLFGSRLAGVAVCASCGEHLDLDFSVDGLLAGAAESYSLTLRDGEYEVELRLPDSLDLLEASRSTDAEHATSLLVERCILTGGVGEPLRTAPLPQHIMAAAARRLADADPQADVQLALVCPSCDNYCTAPFDIVLFLWAEIDAWAARLFADVHVLAGAYGWTERDILSLSDARRRQYLQMVWA
jgi:hypothetical protein